MPCEQRILYRSAMGLLLSYTALVAHESDFAIALHANLLPADLEWDQWIRLSQQLPSFHGRNETNRRYIYGELQTSRLNVIYRLLNPRGSLIHGYMPTISSYAIFFRANFAWLFAAFAYISVALAAMQVGGQNPWLQYDVRFLRASMGLTLFAILAPILALGTGVIVFLVLFIYNLVTTLKNKRRRIMKLELALEQE